MHLNFDVLLHDETCRRRISDRLARLARQAMVAEAELTPKPGLVDRRGPGAHHDLSLELIRRSASVLEPYFSAMALISVGRAVDQSLRDELALIGRDAELAMYTATLGSNAHKGAIWILGLLVAAAAQESGSAQEITMAAGAIARSPHRAQPAVLTHGEIVKILYGVAGARGEACNNFLHIVRFGLPTLRQRRAAGFSEQVSRLDALFNIMAQLDDTCVLYRGGMEALNAVKSGACDILSAGGSSTDCGRKRMRMLDDELAARNVSPGGSADLLAATIFLDAVERHLVEVCTDHSALLDEDEYESELEEIHGAA
ncbi:MAG TPA: triphosphoribosyl-dephospho-CoA synthase [Terriglobales bacterium]|nr:triphosphoribosyl-dephospho-CoA synthase [Terriglobales bacterium]